jgi:predicted ATPase
MHLKRVHINSETFPTRESYPFSLQVYQEPRTVEFSTPVTFFVGENGSGKSTLLEAIVRACGIHIWRETGLSRYKPNPYEETFHHHLTVEWTAGPVPGSFFGSGSFDHFTRMVDEWASADPGQLHYYGGVSLVALSHGQSLMSFFRSRYRIEGLYLLDEPETALSPGTQIELLNLLGEVADGDRAQFIIATHSPILLAHPGSVIYRFDPSGIDPVAYEDTDHYRIYKSFMDDRAQYMSGGEKR